MEEQKQDARLKTITKDEKLLQEQGVGLKPLRTETKLKTDFMARFALLLDLRAQLYFWIATLSAFLVQTEALSNWSDWSSLEWSRTAMGALISGATAVRAYVDQSISVKAEKPADPQL